MEILKGNQRIRELSEPGTPFGEISYFVGGKRSATVKAKTEVQALRVPKDEISGFLKAHPDVLGESARLLAEWLKSCSQILYGLKEFINHLPDAVLVTDKEGKILTWNPASEQLYGREWTEAGVESIDEIYEDPKVYRQILKEVQDGCSVCERSLRIRHPREGRRSISISATVLYDGHHNFQGFVIMGRDATAAERLRRNYRRVWYWLLPVSLLLLALAGAVFWGYPHFSKGYQYGDIRHGELNRLLSKDFLVLKAFLTESFLIRDRARTSYILRRYFEGQDPTRIVYRGVVLLDADKKVFDAFSIKDASPTVGASYAGIPFEEKRGSSHKVLTLYRPHKDHPMGLKSVEIALEMGKDQGMGWLVFQMDMEMLMRQYNMDEQGLRLLKFERS